MLLLPGTGLGLALVNPSQGESDLPEFSFATASAWTARMLVSFWIAGGHGAHGPPRPDNYGGLHGVFAWAVGSLLPAFVMVRSTSLVLGQALLRSAQQSLTARPGPVAMVRRVLPWIKSRPRATRRPISRRDAPVGNTHRAERRFARPRRHDAQQPDRADDAYSRPEPCRRCRPRPQPGTHDGGQSSSSHAAAAKAARGLSMAAARARRCVRPRRDHPRGTGADFELTSSNQV